MQVALNTHWSLQSSRLRQLESFIQQLIFQGETNYPIHVKLETGMNRLGFGESEVNSLIQKVQSQPEIFVKSVYSHLAEADAAHSDFTQTQIDRFEDLSDKTVARISQFTHSTYFEFGGDFKLHSCSIRHGSIGNRDVWTLFKPRHHQTIEASN